MKIAPLFLLLITFSCTNQLEPLVENSSLQNENLESYARLNFENESLLEKAIYSGELPELNSTTKSTSSNKFVSMLSKMTSLKSADGEVTTYYEALGYDTLVPNLNFARLLSPIGELEVGNEIIRITPQGTYRFSRAHENEFLEFIEQDLDYKGEHIENDMYRISENILLYKTFFKDIASYITISEDNNYVLIDDNSSLNFKRQFCHNPVVL